MSPSYPERRRRPRDRGEGGGGDKGFSSAGLLPARVHRGRWPGPECREEPGAAASAPARRARPPSRPGSPGLAAGVARCRGPLLRRPRFSPTGHRRLVNLSPGPGDAEQGRGGRHSAGVNPLSPVHVTPRAPRPDPRGPRWAPSAATEPQLGPPEPGSSAGWVRPQGERHRCRGRRS